MTNQPEPTPAPTPDRAVGDYAVMTALKRYFGECAILRMEPQWHRVQDIVATHEYRLTATERPADWVTISESELRLSSSVIDSTRVVVLQRLAEIQTALNNLDSVQDVLESALSAAGDGEPTDG